METPQRRFPVGMRKLNECLPEARVPNTGCLTETLLSSWLCKDLKRTPLRKWLIGHRCVAGTLWRVKEECKWG